MWMADARGLLDAGVTLVTGTDMTTVTDPDHGEELILEIEGHVEIGMTPLAAIRAATAEGARNLRLDDVTGIRARRAWSADLLVVEGAPDRDIHALRRPVLVVRQGQPIAPDPPRRADAATAGQRRLRVRPPRAEGRSCASVVPR